MQGIFAHTGNVVAGGTANFPPVTIASITDGTSNTFMYGEHAHSKMATVDATAISTASTGGHPAIYGDTTFSSIFPPNYFS